MPKPVESFVYIKYHISSNTDLLNGLKTLSYLTVTGYAVEREKLKLYRKSEKSHIFGRYSTTILFTSF